MKKVQNPRAKAILILTFCLLFCPVPKGRATDEIQLRKYPAPHGPVLDTVLKKTDFKIIESFGPWRYVVIEGSTYGGGWINSEDLKKEASLKKKIKPKTVSKSNAGAKTVSIKPISIRMAEQPVKKKETLIKVAAPLTITAFQSKKKTANNASKTSKPSEPAPKKEAQLPQPSIPAFEAVPPEEKPGAGKKVAKLDNEAPPVKTTVANPLENAAIPPFKDGHLWNGSMIATAEASENAVNPAIAQQSGQSPPEKVGEPPRQTAIKEILHIGLRLLTVIMSCLAIIFSYKAKKMADMSYALTLQLQQNMKINLGREFDDRY